MPEPLSAAAAQRCIDRYIAAWNARDFAAMARHFTEQAVFVLAGATQVLATRSELETFLRTIFAALEARGFGHTVIGKVTTRQLGATLLLAEVDDIRRYHRDGHLMETIEVQYTLRVDADADSGLRMVSALWCEPGWRQRLL